MSELTFNSSVDKRRYTMENYSSKILSITLVFAFSLIFLAANPSTLNAKEEVKFDFWAAPNPPQKAFWQDMANKYMEANPNVKIKVNSMPESPTSEAGIQTAIAGGTIPAASGNINPGFGNELFKSEAIVSLNKLKGWETLIESRDMEKAIKGWKFSDGNYYVLPVYSNPMLIGWRLDIIEKVGSDEPPKTYSEIIDLGQELKEKFPGKFIWVREALGETTGWERWFDFFILYHAASNGQPLISGGEVTADDGAAIEVLSFLSNLAKNDLLTTRTMNNPFEEGYSVMSQIGPWTFPSWKEQYPNLKFGETYTLKMPPVPKGTPANKIKTFGDSKGVVVYSQVSEEKQRAAWEFISWVFKKASNDLKWLQQTGLLPVRGNLTNQDGFQNYFENNPQMIKYAENIPNAVPALKISNWSKVQKELGDEAVVPVIRGKKKPKEAWEDWKLTVKKML